MDIHTSSEELKVNSALMKCEKDFDASQSFYSFDAPPPFDNYWNNECNDHDTSSIPEIKEKHFKHNVKREISHLRDKF